MHAGFHYCEEKFPKKIKWLDNSDSVIAKQLSMWMRQIKIVISTQIYILLGWKSTNTALANHIKTKFAGL